MNDAPFDPETAVAHYRHAVEQHAAAKDDWAKNEWAVAVLRLRRQWSAWSGGDINELHEVAYGRAARLI